MVTADQRQDLRVERFRGSQGAQRGVRLHDLGTHPHDVWAVLPQGAHQVLIDLHVEQGD